MNAAVVSGVLGLVLLSANSAAATVGRCIDSESIRTDDGRIRHLLTNTCRDVREVTIRAGSEGKVCDVLRIEPNATRAFVQKEACASLSELIRRRAPITLCTGPRAAAHFAPARPGS